MSAVSAAIAANARKCERAILQALAQRSQARVAELMGVSDSTISRFDKAAAAAFIAACGFKLVPQDRVCFDLEYIHSLKVLAGVGLKAPEPISLDWSDDT